MFQIRLPIAAIVVSILIGEVAGDDIDSSVRRYERGLLTHAVITDDGLHVVTAAFVPAMDRGGFRWGAWVVVHNLAAETTEVVGDGVGPVVMSPDQSRVVFASYTREPRSNQPDCNGLVVRNFSEGESLELSFPNGFRPVLQRPRTVLACCWDAEGNRLFALDGWGNLCAWDLTQSQPAPFVVDSLHLEYSVGWGWRGPHPGIELRCDADGALQLTLPQQDDGVLSVEWSHEVSTGAWSRTSEAIEESEQVTRIEGPLITEFQSPDGRFTLVDNLDDLTLTDREGQPSITLPFRPERPQLSTQ